MANILLIEDEAALAEAVSKGLREELFVVETCGDGEGGLWAARSGSHDLIVLDLQLPVLNGLEVCRRLRAAGSTVPILMLTARDAVEDVVRGLDTGANDYLTKPFAFAEFLARVRALLRRRSLADTAVYEVADLTMDTVTREVRRAGKAIALTTKEYQILECLLRNKGRVMSRAQLCAAVWDRDLGPDSNVIEVHVAALRRKLDRDRTHALIHTVRSVGYVLRPPSS